MEREIQTPVKNSTDRLTLFIRPDTTDEKVIKEVLVQDVYEKKSIDFFVTPGDFWLDLGGNIGTFALLALTRGAKVISYEPEEDNYGLMLKNVQKNFGKTRNFKGYKQAVGVTNGTVDLYLCQGDYNKYRHTIFPRRGRSSIPISMVSIRNVLAKHKGLNAIKIDIEGAEIEMLEQLTPGDYTGIKKMVLEYSFDVDRSIPRFLRIMDRLKTYFPNVHWTKVKANEEFYNYFPAATLVFCYF